MERVVDPKSTVIHTKEGVQNISATAAVGNKKSITTINLWFYLILNKDIFNLKLIECCKYVIFRRNS